jgi:hypothetical protein
LPVLAHWSAAKNALGREEEEWILIPFGRILMMTTTEKRIVLILGSAPNVQMGQSWPRAPFTDVVAINNAWRVRPDWNYLVHADDFPADRHPPEVTDQQRIVTSQDYVPEQNKLGGFVYAGGTMAFTAGYWALGALRPSIIAFLGCDMVYPKAGNTHFYGTGQADPLRRDISLRNLEAKSARLMLKAAQQGCLCVNLSQDPSRLVFPRAERGDLGQFDPQAFDPSPIRVAQAEESEKELGYFVESGRYWEVENQFDPAKIDALDDLWLSAADHLATNFGDQTQDTPKALR